MSYPDVVIAYGNMGVSGKHSNGEIAALVKHDNNMKVIPMSDLTDHHNY